MFPHISLMSSNLFFFSTLVTYRVFVTCLSVHFLTSTCRIFPFISFIFVSLYFSFFVHVYISWVFCYFLSYISLYIRLIFLNMWSVLLLVVCSLCSRVVPVAAVLVNLPGLSGCLTLRDIHSLSVLLYFVFFLFHSSSLFQSVSCGGGGRDCKSISYCGILSLPLL